MKPVVLLVIHGVPIYWDGARIYFETGMTVDGDGSPRCYGPQDSGLDFTANAGHPGNWWGVVTDQNGRPVVQDENDPAPGMWVSQTSYVRSGHATDDPKRYLNSEKIVFMVLPGPIRHMVEPVVLGCKSRITRYDDNFRQNIVDGLCGDFGPSNHLGEGSVFAAQLLNINPGYDAKKLCRYGGTSERMLWEFWPGQQSDPQNGEDFPLIPA